MSAEEAEPPQYIVTAPGEDNDDDDDDKSSTTTTTSTATTINTGKDSLITASKNKVQNIRSNSLQSASTTSSATFLDQSTLSNATLMQQLKAQSSMNIVSEKHIQKYSSTSTSSQTTSSTTTSGTKGKFTSFLQHPDQTVSSHGATFLTAQQKHVRQFVRSTSAHSSTDGGSSGIAISGKTEKCIRSTSQQIDDGFDHNLMIEQTKGFHQSAAILISKSAETIEGFKSSGSMRTQLTLSGGLLAPPNRKLTILSPVHAPPGLQEILKRHRSPLSPRISFPGTDAELFP